VDGTAYEVHRIPSSYRVKGNYPSRNARFPV
jgi:hypothetical protein